MPTALANDAIIIDIRAPEKFAKGHIPLAVNQPLDHIKKGLISLPKNRTLIVYCDTGGASMLAARLLSNMGYTVINCIGGIRDYTGSLSKGN